MKTVTNINVKEMKQINGGAKSPYEEPWRKPGKGVGISIGCTIGITDALINKNLWALAACVGG
ncbi:MAG: hypothetical protein RR494_11300 [Vagococcus sp.]|uniref:hypothetical protein n=1 Tax=Vagococcus TaxID=2737 RepID=UPI002FC68CA0